MKIIDPHHHLWHQDYFPWLGEDLGETFFGNPAPIQKNYLLEDFFEDAERYDLAKSVAVEAGYDRRRNPAGETRWLQSVADSPNSRGFPHGIVGFADLSDSGVEVVLAEHCRHPNIRGIRQILNRHQEPLLNVAERDYLNDETWRRNYGLLEKFGLSFDLQIYHQQMADAASLARQYPDIQVILNHTGMPVDRDEEGLRVWETGMRALAECLNVAVKISGLGIFDRVWTTESIRGCVERTIDIFGIDRCMFASDFPVDKLTSDYDQIWNAFDTITKKYSDDERCKLFVDNAEKYYQL